MTKKLTVLYNTLRTITTKGDDTKTMANCLVFLEQLISDEQKEELPDNHEQESSK